MSADEPRYSVCTENGAIHLHTDDRGEADEHAAWLNGQPEEGLRLPSGELYQPGRASVWENQPDGTMTELEPTP